MIPGPTAPRAGAALGCLFRPVLASLLLAFLLAPSSALAVARPIEGGLIRLHYNRAPLKTIIEEIARAVGERIAFDPGTAGNFTITIDRPVTREEALALLDAALVMRGYALLRSGEGTLRVLKITDAATASPWVGPVALREDRDQLVTTMISLESAPAGQVASQMKHLVSKQDSLVAYAASNALIMTGTERRVRRMIELAQALDVGGGEDLWVRTLRHRGALNVSEILREALSPPDKKSGLRQHGEIRIWADERTNTVLIVGAEAQLDRARALVAELDQPPGVDTKIQVIRIYHRDATEIQDLLAKMSAGRAATGRGAAPGPFGSSFFSSVDEGTNSVIVDAEPDTFASLLAVIERLDRPQPRVQVDVIAYEITNPTQLRLGVDWFMPVLEPESDGSGNILTIASVPSGDLRAQQGDDITFFGRLSKDPLLVPFEDENGNITDIVVPRETLVTTANSRQVRARSLMRPRLLMIAGEEQRIFAGQNIPVVVSRNEGPPNSPQLNNQVERYDVGIELRTTARVGEDGQVSLDLFIQISRVTFSEAGDPASVGPTLDKREIETTVNLADGQLAVIGLSQEGARTEERRGTPFLSDVPVLGHALGSGGSRDQDLHVLFAVQARLLKSTEEDLAESMRQRLALERSLARVSGLRRNPKAPYAVLVTTRTQRDDAVMIAESFEREGYRAQVGSWEGYGGGTRNDVYLTGYSDLAVAGGVSLRLRERGFGPQVVVLPGEINVAKNPALRMLGASP